MQNATASTSDQAAATPVSVNTAVAPKKTPACKICCACPAARRARDECAIFKGLDECQNEIGAFYQCLLDEGFSQTDVDSLRKNVRRM